MSQPHDPHPPSEPAGLTRPPADDDELGRLVRGAAESWAMPSVRLDEAGWRERVRTPRARRVAVLRGWMAILGRAAAASLVLSVSAALLGVWLTRPLGPSSQSQGPSGTNAVAASPRPSHSGPAASPLPKLLVEGDTPSPSQVIVTVDSGFAQVDLTTGTIGNAVASGQYGSVVRRAPDGSVYCLCVSGDTYLGGGYSHVAVTWGRYVDGVAAPAKQVGDYRGAPTPGEEGNPEQPGNVLVRVSFADESGIAFVGWTIHAHPAWKSGLVIVNVTNGSVIQRIDLPDRSDGTATSRTGADAPRIIGTAGPGRLAIARPWYSWSPPTSRNPTYSFGADAFIADRDAGRISNVAPLAAASECGDQLIVSGTLADGSWWLGCAADEFSRAVVRRLGADDHVLGDTQVPTSLDIGDAGGTSMVSHDGSSLFLWNPMSLVLTRVDLATGELTTGTGQVALAADDPLAALGRWLTPSAAAKVLLSSGIALSPDGTRIYALGIASGGSADRLPGSAGLFVFDTASLAQVDHWNATADFVSIAVSADGKFVYAAGSPEMGADGSSTTQAASITVFDATDGSVRLLAGQLGHGFILFPSTILR